MTPEKHVYMTADLMRKVRVATALAQAESESEFIRQAIEHELERMSSDKRYARALAVL